MRYLQYSSQIDYVSGSGSLEDAAIKMQPNFSSILALLIKTPRRGRSLSSWSISRESIRLPRAISSAVWDEPNSLSNSFATGSMSASEGVSPRSCLSYRPATQGSWGTIGWLNPAMGSSGNASGIAQIITHYLDIHKFTRKNTLLSKILVTLTTTQVETLFGELEYIEPRLKALDVALADEEVDRA